ncbi:carbonic anhydrase [Roseateles sp.]|uniref:carbonic anhydrase n=1 Tax=Roseateles sp. TaxID=1971397 RepID=UPI0025E3DBE9|nr:carbonic anhydrase family protein [Roseateles sp.]
MKTRVILVACLLALAARAEEPKEPVEVLRQRLAERLATPVEGVATARPAARAARSAKAAKAQPPKPVHWGYTGEAGPEHWAELAPENRLCAVGTRQSPIDIREGLAVDLERIAFDYHPGSFSVLDNGHTIQVNVAPGSGLSVMGRRYELQQFHFHRPSEERVNGKLFDMVAHLVHKDAQGRLAVVAVLLERGGDDMAHPVIQAVWGNLPLEKGEDLPAQGQIDPSQLLPEQRGYYTYMGSLTTPPCSEGVLWMVLRQPVALSGPQLDVFARLYPMNARPLQAGSGRLIKESQ